MLPQSRQSNARRIASGRLSAACGCSPGAQRCSSFRRPWPADTVPGTDGEVVAYAVGTGAERWRFRTDGSISGSASLVDGIVYFSNGSHHTYGLDARTGRVVWRFPAGEYTPVVADRHRLYVVGYRLVYGLAPRSARK